MAFILSLLFAFALADSAIIPDSVATQYINEQEDRYFLFDDSAQSFREIPRSIESVDSLLTLASDERSNDSATSFNAARQALVISNDIDYKEGIATSHNIIGIKYLDFGDHELAHMHYLKAMGIEEQRGNAEGIARLLNNIAQIYIEQENYNEGAKYLEASMDTWMYLGEERETLVSTNNLGYSPA